MPAADQLDVDGVTAVGVAAAELDRDGLVGVAVHEQHLRIRRLVDRRRRALREQALDGPGAGAELGRQPQVAHGRLREHAARADAIRREQREVPARAVTRERDALRDRPRRAAPRRRRRRRRAARASRRRSRACGTRRSRRRGRAAARSAATRYSRSRPYCARQQPPWISTTAGWGGSPPAGSQSSATCSACGPYCSVDCGRPRHHLAGSSSRSAVAARQQSW